VTPGANAVSHTPSRRRRATRPPKLVAEAWSRARPPQPRVRQATKMCGGKRFQSSIVAVKGRARGSGSARRRRRLQGLTLTNDVSDVKDTIGKKCDQPKRISIAHIAKTCVRRNWYSEELSPRSAPMPASCASSAVRDISSFHHELLYYLPRSATYCQYLPVMWGQLSKGQKSRRERLT
jgi:hypothetical protein